MVDVSLEHRIIDLCGFVVGMVRSRGRKRITILIDGETFGVASIEDLLNPRGPIPQPPHMAVETGGKITPP